MYLIFERNMMFILIKPAWNAENCKEFIEQEVNFYELVLIVINNELK